MLLSRPIEGKDCKRSPETELPTVAFKVCNSAPVAVTSTIWLTEPSSMVELSVIADPTFTTWPVNFATRKPVLFMVKL